MFPRLGIFDRLRSKNNLVCYKWQVIRPFLGVGLGPLSKILAVKLLSLEMLLSPGLRNMLTSQECS